MFMDNTTTSLREKRHLNSILAKTITDKFLRMTVRGFITFHGGG